MKLRLLCALLLCSLLTGCPTPSVPPIQPPPPVTPPTPAAPTYTWGVIGDTTASWSGTNGSNTWDALSILPSDMAVIGTTAYVTDSYAEGRSQAAQFTTSAPQVPTNFVFLNVCVYLTMAATDGNLVYFVNTGSGWSGDNSYVMAVNPSGALYKFPSGQPATDCGSQYVTAIDLAPSLSVSTPGASSETGLNPATGIAVQTSGNILAVAHGPQNQILLFDKTSGASLSSISLPSPGRMAFEPDGTLWAISGTTVVQIASVGAADTVGASLPGLVAPIAVSTDPAMGNVWITDGGSSQQVKEFSEAGALLFTYGTAGGVTDCNPTVSNNHLFLDHTAGPGYDLGSGYETTAFVHVMPDGTIWFGDPGNARVLHITATGQYIEQISFLRFLYYIAADHGNPARVFADTLEYQVNYGVPLQPGDPNAAGGNGAWKLVNNWSVCQPGWNAATGKGIYSQQFAAVMTFPNGLTYAEISNSNPTPTTLAGPYPELVQLPPSGPLKFSGQPLEQAPWQGEYFDHAGNLNYWNTTATLQLAMQQPLTGYSTAGWPTWGVPVQIASIPETLVTPSSGGAPTSNQPAVYPGWGMAYGPQATTSNMVPTYMTAPGTTVGADYHLGAVALGGTAWAWENGMQGADLTVTSYNGQYNDAGGYGGHDGIAVDVEGNYVLAGYDGQWGSFASQWYLYTDQGAFVHQFGNGFSNPPTNGTLILGAAGNIATMTTVTYDGCMYLYNSDEGNHPGIHQWAICGLSPAP